MRRCCGSQNLLPSAYFDSGSVENSCVQLPQTGPLSRGSRVCLHLSERSVPVCRQRPLCRGGVISFVWVLEIVNTPDGKRARFDCEQGPTGSGKEERSFVFCSSQILSEISSCLDYSGLRLQAVQESLSFNSPIKASASSHLATSLRSGSRRRINQPNLLQGTCKSFTRNMPYNGENSGSD